MTRRIFLLLLGCVMLVSGLSSLACTSVIISGKASPDGRPMILKNRDTGHPSNLMLQYQGLRYRYVGIVNSGDVKGYEIWGGHNEAGFAIINTANYNLNTHEEAEELEGVVMQKALSLCATLKDFEQLLDTLPRPLCLNTNFGVIDAQGGCAYYETGHEGYVKFDANDPTIAPRGYLIRSNYGVTGDTTKYTGVERYMAMEQFMDEAWSEHRMEASYLATAIPRYLRHGLTHIDFHDYMPANENEMRMMPFQEYIPRHATACCLLVEGVKTGEPSSLTTSWALVGYPLTTVAIPILVTPSACLPQVVTDRGDGKSWIAEVGLQLKRKLFPYRRGNHVGDFINIAPLLNRSHTGILQLLKPVEDKVVSRGKKVIDSMRGKGNIDEQALHEYYDWANTYIRQQYQELFNLPSEP